MDALEWKLDEQMPYLQQLLREEVRKLWGRGAIDTEDFNISFKACIHVALRNVADKVRPLSDEEEISCVI